MINDLLLLSGNDIPFEKAQITIHQPTLKEIAYIGEEMFYTGCEFINFSKDMLEEQDKINLEHLSNFDVLMSIIREHNTTAQKGRVSILFVLSLLFPKHTISFEKTQIKLVDVDNKNVSYINNDNFIDFKQIINNMFCLSNKQREDEYKPMGDLASKIANKLKKRHQTLAEQKQEVVKIAILSRYASILAVGEQKDLNNFMQYTVYQLFDEFKRYELKMSYDIYFQAKLAGAKDLKEVEDWMKDIHP